MQIVELGIGARHPYGLLAAVTQPTPRVGRRSLLMVAPLKGYCASTRGHDAGGNRRQAVDALTVALPRLIDAG
jgi:hypothetical protein